MITTHTHRERTDKLGTSMLELTAALFVFSVGMMGAFQTFHYTLSRMRVLKEDGIAMRAIQNEMETLRGTDFSLLATGTHEFAERSPGLEQLADVTATVELRPFNSGDSGLLVAEVVVRWTGDQGRAMEKSAATLVGDRGGAR